MFNKQVVSNQLSNSAVQIELVKQYHVKVYICVEGLSCAKSSKFER